MSAQSPGFPGFNPNFGAPSPAAGAHPTATFPVDHNGNPIWNHVPHMNSPHPAPTPVATPAPIPAPEFDPTHIYEWPGGPTVPMPRYHQPAPQKPPPVQQPIQQPAQQPPSPYNPIPSRHGSSSSHGSSRSQSSLHSIPKWLRVSIKNGYYGAPVFDKDMENLTVALNEKERRMKKIIEDLSQTLKKLSSAEDLPCFEAKLRQMGT